MTLIKFKNGGSLGSLPLFESSFGFPSFVSDSLDRMWSNDRATWIPAVNITERADDFKIDLAVPGMDKKDFKIEVEDGSLVVSGERREENKEENEKVSRREFFHGSFSRTFNLPEYVDQEKIEASYYNGILSILVAKQDEAKEKAKKLIEIQ